MERQWDGETMRWKDREMERKWDERVREGERWTDSAEREIARSVRQIRLCIYNKDLVKLGSSSYGTFSADWRTVYWLELSKLIGQSCGSNFFFWQKVQLKTDLLNHGHGSAWDVFMKVNRSGKRIKVCMKIWWNHLKYFILFLQLFNPEWAIKRIYLLTFEKRCQSSVFPVSDTLKQPNKTPDSDTLIFLRM